MRRRNSERLLLVLQWAGTLDHNLIARNFRIDSWDDRVLASGPEVKFASDFEKGTVELSGSRVIVITTEMFAALQRDLTRVLGAVGSTVLYVIGDSLGRSAFRLFRNGAGTDLDAWRELDSCFRMMGWGTLNSHMENDHDASTVTIGNSVFSDKTRSKQPNCDIVRGILRGWDNSSSGSPVRVQEVACIACGHHDCTFKLLKGP